MYKFIIKILSVYLIFNMLTVFPFAADAFPEESVISSTQNNDSQFQDNGIEINRSDQKELDDKDINSNLSIDKDNTSTEKTDKDVDESNSKLIFDDKDESTWMGGINRFNSESICSSRKETETLEKKLQDKNFIKVSGNNKDISDEDYSLFYNSSYAPFKQYQENISDYYKEYCNIYVYKPYYDKAIKLIKSNSNIRNNNTLKNNISRTSVVIDYGYWTAIENAGKVLNRYNDNIPDIEKDKVGYLSIKSPINATIRLKDAQRLFYDDIDITANSETIIKLPVSEYHVSVINNVDINDFDEDIAIRNIIWIESENTEDNPCEINLETVVINKNIPDKETNEIYNPTETSIEGNTEINEESTTTDKETFPKIEDDTDISEKDTVVNNENNINNYKFIILVLIWIIIFLICLYFKKRKKKK